MLYLNFIFDASCFRDVGRGLFGRRASISLTAEQGLTGVSYSFLAKAS